MGAEYEQTQVIRRSSRRRRIQEKVVGYQAIQQKKISEMDRKANIDRYQRG